MMKPKHNFLISGFLKRYIHKIVLAQFGQIHVNPVELSADHAVLLLANHFSWWDGFLMHYLNNKFFKKKFHVMILEGTIKKHGFMSYLGAFSVDKNSRSLFRSLDYVAELLNDPNNLVLIFPQGKLYSNFSSKIVFQKGLQHIFENIKKPVQLVFAANFIEYFDGRKPSVYAYLQNRGAGINYQLADVQKAYQSHFDTSKEKQAQIVI